MIAAAREPENLDDQTAPLQNHRHTQVEQPQKASLLNTVERPSRLHLTQPT